MLRTKMLGPFGRDRRAVTAIEYALIAAFFTVVILVAAHALGSSAANTFNSVPPALLSHATNGGTNPDSGGGLF
jgi:Flp pilus assembly pilin Flp